MGREIKTILMIFLIMLSGLSVSLAGPVKDRTRIYSQPDGSTFPATVRGDEWTRIRTTADGCAIVIDEEGWWCYGIYDEYGRIQNTGYKVGESVPSGILADSRRIPYRRLSENAEEIRSKVSRHNAEALQTTRNSTHLATKSSSVVTKKQGIALLVEFQDVKFTYKREDFHNLLNQKGYNGSGSAKDYYEAQFGENWEFSFDVSEVITLSNNLKYYGENNSDGMDSRPAMMVKEACEAADEHIDFSKYDQNGDGVVDNVYIFYAGHDEAEDTENTSLIWGHQYYIYSGSEHISLFCDGVRIDRYACSSELSGVKDMTGIGTFCHEFTHTLGVADFYDTNYDEDGSWAAGLWRSTSLMDAGNYNNKGATPPNLNCLERMVLGLSLPEDIEVGNSYTMSPIEKSGVYYKLNTDVEGEYYLFEYRSNDGWDKYIGGKGMLVYHVDENGKAGKMDRWFYQNIVNTDASHQCADLIEADNRSDLITGFQDFQDIRGIFFPHGSTTAMTPENTLTYKFWSGNTPPVSIVGITEANGHISFRAISSGSVPEIPDIDDFRFTSFPDAIFVEFNSKITDIQGNAILEWRKKGETEYNAINLKPAHDNKYRYLVKGLESGNILYEIQIRFEIDGVFGNIFKSQIMTKRSPAISWPYLFTSNGGKIDKEKGFIAHAVNASGAAEQFWYLDGKELKIEDNCLVFPQTDGNLSCRIIWEDGSTDTITKKITLIEE